MTLAATRRFAFGASVLLGVAATVVATTLVTLLLGSPEEVLLALSDPDLSSFLRLLLDQFVAALRIVLSLL